MKLWILVLAIVLFLQITSGKSTEKSQRKKASVAKKKPSKSSKLNVDAFRSLPPEDFEFIKELDKQFKLHGDNIRIKVERINGTSKNSKRTIDGELGYGYHGQGYNSGYQFSQPKYMIYPYSQHDIPAPMRSFEKTVVTIQPSQAYEIKEEPVNYGNQNQYDHSGYVPYQAIGEYFAEPVIILRIPGPTKYASHLQALLQQYLEIRAAQYLRALQESEAQYHSTDSYQPQYHPEPVNPSYAQDIYQHQPIEQVYQNYAYRQQQKGNQEPQQYQITYEPHDGSSGLQQSNDQEHAYEYSHASQSSVNTYSEHESSYRYHTPVYEYSTHHETSGPQAAYGLPAHAEQDSYSDEKTNLPISENYPSHTHTKVVFTDGGNKDHSSSYPLPSISVIPKYQNSRQKYQHSDSNYNQEYLVQQNKPHPFNYHPEVSAKGLKRNAPTREEQYSKLNKLISRLKKKSQPKAPESDESLHS